MRLWPLIIMRDAASARRDLRRRHAAAVVAPRLRAAAPRAVVACVSDETR